MLGVTLLPVSVNVSRVGLVRIVQRPVRISFMADTAPRDVIVSMLWVVIT